MVMKCRPGAPPSSSCRLSSVASSTPTRRTAAGSSPAAFNRSTTKRGRSAPDSSANRWIWFSRVTGMMPGMIGRSEPSERTRSTSSK